jgi:hypothetical protein
MDKEITKNIIDIYFKTPEKCREALSFIGKSGWKFEPVSKRTVQLKGNIGYVNKPLSPDIPQNWEYLNKDEPVGRIAFDYSVWIPDDLTAILECCVKILTRLSYVVIDVISEEKEGIKNIGFVLDDNTKIISQGQDYIEAAISLFYESWLQDYEFRRPGLVDLPKVSGITSAYLGEPTIESKQPPLIIKRYKEYLIKTNEPPQYWWSETDLRKHGYFGTIKTLEGEFHIVFEGYSKSKKDS